MLFHYNSVSEIWPGSDLIRGVAFGESDLTSGMASLERNNLVVFHYNSVSEIWPGSDLIRKVAFGGSGLIIGVAFGLSGLIRGVAFDVGVAYIRWRLL